MKVQHKDFIAVYHDVFEDGFCSHLIQEFERCAATGAGSDRLQSENAAGHVKKDYQLQLNGKNMPFEAFNGRGTEDVFYEGLQKCYDNYTTKYSILAQSGRVNCNSIKLQRTMPKEGYHVWHCEQGHGAHGNRVLVYSLYLNTLTPEQAGETEFLYQEERIRPVENTLVLWPAAFTHPHRGNPVYGEENKYIVTGWFLYE